jgi:urea transport system permease protein
MEFLEILFNGLSFSSILILTALGLAITFGVMRVINMAHGEMLMLGAYTAFVVAPYLAVLDFTIRLPGTDHRLPCPLGFCAAVPIAFVVVGFVGFLLEITLVRYLYGRPLDTLLATWGVGLIIQQVVRLTLGTDVKMLSPPDSLNGGWEVEGHSVGVYRIFIIGFTLFALLVIYLVFFKTNFGLKIRAVTQNRPMASAMGISTRQIDSLTFALGAGLAGVAGCIMGHMYPIKPHMGGEYVIDAFMVVILGGVGQLAGTVTGGSLVGTGTGVTEAFIGSKPLARVVVLLLVIVFIQFRPQGVFAPKERVYD